MTGFDRSEEGCELHPIRNGKQMEAIKRSCILEVIRVNLKFNLLMKPEILFKKTETAQEPGIWFIK